jgi:hypothetical protein
MQLINLEFFTWREVTVRKALENLRLRVTNEDGAVGDVDTDEFHSQTQP